MFMHTVFHGVSIYFLCSKIMELPLKYYLKIIFRLWTTVIYILCILYTFYYFTIRVLKTKILF